MAIGLKGLNALKNRIRKLEKEHTVDCESLCTALGDAETNYDQVVADNGVCVGNCGTLSGPSFTVDVQSAVNTDTDWSTAPYNQIDPGSGGWIAVTYGVGAPLGQDVLAIATTASFLTSLAGVIIYGDNNDVCIPEGGFSTIGDFVPGSVYQFNIGALNQVLDSSTVPGLEGEFSVENCIQDCNDEFDIPAAQAIVDAAAAAADAGSCQPCP